MDDEYLDRLSSNLTDLILYLQEFQLDLEDLNNQLEKEIDEL